MKIVQSVGANTAAGRLRVSLLDTNAEMTAAWIQCFFGVESVEILQGDLLEVGADAVVSPANSFGDMSGGVDKRIDDFFGGAAQAAIRARIQSEFLGELPVGMAIVVPMPSTRIRYVIAAPTMRVPQDVAGTLNAYLAMRAVLVAIREHNVASNAPIRSVAVPGLCTGVGQMPCAEAAAQMRAAFDNVEGGGWKDVLHPVTAPLALGSASIAWRRAT
jgi:O-acetyl-ADP-ribose deacetylase (regulator of RNase III)